MAKKRSARSKKVTPQKRNLLLILALVGSLILTVFLVQQIAEFRGRAAKTVAGSFSFTAAGDHGIDTEMQASVTKLKSSGTAFHLALGDLSYQPGSEQEWCDQMHQGQKNVFLVAGNHDVGQAPGGDINAYIKYCTFTLNNLQGDYGLQYYFDYPESSPIARFIMISPGMEKYVGLNYASGGEGYTFTEDAIADAHGKNIPWIIVGMHKNCISSGEKSCEIGEDLMNLFIDQKVDLVLQAHDHNYQRSHLLSCATAGQVDSTCILDDGKDGKYQQGADGEGTLFLITGTFGKKFAAIRTSDSEAGYFSLTNSNTNGFAKITLSPTTLTTEFVPSGGGSLKDSFTIQSTATGGDTTPAPSEEVSITPEPTSEEGAEPTPEEGAEEPSPEETPAEEDPSQGGKNDGNNKQGKDPTLKNAKDNTSADEDRDVSRDRTKNRKQNTNDRRDRRGSLIERLRALQERIRSRFFGR